jgi:hypothetical protein
MGITLKALANSSPGFALKPWERVGRDFCNSEGVCGGVRYRKTFTTPSELRNLSRHSLSQGFKANPGLELANAFSVIIFMVLAIWFASL